MYVKNPPSVVAEGGWRRREEVPPIQEIKKLITKSKTK